MSEPTRPQPIGGRVGSPTSTEFVDFRVSDDIPTNDHGIVVLENPQPCIGEGCHLRGEDEECFLDLDHLHHSAAYYEYYGPLAVEFRAQDVLSRWVFRCIHEKKHDLYPNNVPLPNRKVMERAITEARLLKEIEVNYRGRMALESNLERDDFPKFALKADRRNLDKHKKDKKSLVKSVESIEFLPQQIVTGALLLASPGHAESRLIADPNFMLPGTIRPHEVLKAWRAAQEMLQRREERNKVLEEARGIDLAFLEAVGRAA